MKFFYFHSNSVKTWSLWKIRRTVIIITNCEYKPVGRFVIFHTFLEANNIDTLLDNGFYKKVRTGCNGWDTYSRILLDPKVMIMKVQNGRF